MAFLLLIFRDDLSFKNDNFGQKMAFIVIFKNFSSDLQFKPPRKILKIYEWPSQVTILSLHELFFIEIAKK
jgi:hypothetical protein